MENYENDKWDIAKYLQIINTFERPIYFYANPTFDKVFEIEEEMVKWFNKNFEDYQDVFDFKKLFKLKIRGCSSYKYNILSANTIRVGPLIYTIYKMIPQDVLQETEEFLVHQFYKDAKMMTNFRFQCEIYRKLNENSHQSTDLRKLGIEKYKLASDPDSIDKVRYDSTKLRSSERGLENCST